MARRSKHKRPRFAYITTHGLTTPAYRDLLSAELWYIVFSYCLPATLFAVRDTCRMFRDIVDRDSGVLLARAPLLLPFAPPDPRRYMQLIGNPLTFRAMRDFFGIGKSRTRGLYGSATYTRLLFQPGKCTVCKQTTEGPPMSLYSKVYLCSARCKQNFFWSQVHFLKPHRRYLPGRALCDRHIVPWLPHLTYTSGRRRTVVLIRDLKKARREYIRETVSPHAPEERKRRKEALFKQYSHRCHLRKALLTFQCYVDDWIRETGIVEKNISRANHRRLSKVALKRRIPARLTHGSAARRFVAKRTKNLQHIALTRLRSATIFKSKSRRRRCDQCGVVVGALRLDAHVAQHHADQLLGSRLNADTGTPEYSCTLCESEPVKWLSKSSLQAHRYHKHGIRIPKLK